MRARRATINWSVRVILLSIDWLRRLFWCSKSLYLLWYTVASKICNLEWALQMSARVCGLCISPIQMCSRLSWWPSEFNNNRKRLQNSPLFTFHSSVQMIYSLETGIVSICAACYCCLCCSIGFTSPLVTLVAASSSSSIFKIVTYRHADNKSLSSFYNKWMIPIHSKEPTNSHTSRCLEVIVKALLSSLSYATSGMCQL